VALDSERQVRAERTGWRDESISARHRMYGWDVPAVDIDFLLIEYDKGVPCALVEYKAMGARFPNLNHPTYRAIRVLADAAKVPFLVVFYEAGSWTYTAIAGNAQARTFLGYSHLLMAERAYVRRLYVLRNREPNERVLNKCNSEISETMKRWFRTLKSKLN
jgi:hypothetical protein